MADRLLGTPTFSSQAIPGSISEIDELSAAIATSKKKPVPKKLPPHIDEKQLVVFQIKGQNGPEPGSRPLINTRGKIAIPATKAIRVSSDATDSEAKDIDCPEGM